MNVTAYLQLVNPFGLWLLSSSQQLQRQMIPEYIWYFHKLTWIRACWHTLLPIPLSLRGFLVAIRF